MRKHGSLLLRAGTALLAAMLLAGCASADSAKEIAQLQTLFEEFAQQKIGAYEYTDDPYSNDAYGPGIVYFLQEQGKTIWLYQVPREDGLQETLVYHGKYYGKATFAGMTEWSEAGEAGPDPAMPGFGVLRGLLDADLWQPAPTEAEPLRLLLSSQGKKQLRQQEINGAQEMLDAVENDSLKTSAELMMDYAKVSSYTGGTLTGILSEDGGLAEIRWEIEMQRPQITVNERGEQTVSKETTSTQTAYRLKPLALSEADIEKRIGEATAGLS